ncbi:helix-turn-helix domain-containing protein [Stieleria mannarensis]|uniref:helix-turn-helix domain-containing protein n=1 Tax=Stieleria mannarensis TaxID=2755585 RepID=UPI00160289F0|nr:helix-turn-helix transcriptional regulator [Rhodopirellula sp. JC639]
MAAKEILSKVGKRVRDLREAKGWSQEELGFQSGLHRNYVGGVERGERNLALINLEKLATALGVRARDLLP